MFVSLAFLSAVALVQSTVGSIADQASRPLWIVAAQTDLLAAVDRPPAITMPEQTVDASFWIFQPEQGGVDAIAAAVTVDCHAGTVVHHSFTGYAGTSLVGAAAATNVSAQPVEPDTVYGALVEHLCEPHTEAHVNPDYTDFTAAQAARPTSL